MAERTGDRIDMRVLHWIAVVVLPIILAPIAVLLTGHGALRLSDEFSRLQYWGVGSILIACAGFWFALIAFALLRVVPRFPSPWMAAVVGIVLSVCSWLISAWLLPVPFAMAWPFIFLSEAILVGLLLLSAASAGAAQRKEKSTQS